MRTAYVRYEREYLDDPETQVGQEASILGQVVGEATEFYKSTVVVKDPNVPPPTIWDMLEE